MKVPSWCIDSLQPEKNEETESDVSKFDAKSIKKILIYKLNIHTFLGYKQGSVCYRSMDTDPICD